MASALARCCSPTNRWIIATSPAELQCTAQAWNGLLKRAGLRVAWQEACWCSTAPDTLDAGVSVADVMITVRTRDNGFNASGVWITFDAHFTKV